MFIEGILRGKAGLTGLRRESSGIGMVEGTKRVSVVSASHRSEEVGRGIHKDTEGTALQNGTVSTNQHVGLQTMNTVLARGINEPFLGPREAVSETC